MSFPPGTEMFQFPGFASATYGFSDGYPLARVGCPIRRSSDQSLLAAPRGLSQRATSFIASWRQGIHQMPLLSSAHPSDNRTCTPCYHPTKSATSLGPRPVGTRARATRGEAAVVPERAIPATTNSLYQRPHRRLSGGGAGIPMPSCDARTLRRKIERGYAHRLPAPVHARRTKALRETFAPADGLHHHHTMSKEHKPHGRPPTCIRPDAAGPRAGEGFPFRDGRVEPTQATRARIPRMRAWWAWADLNGRPHAYQACALTS
jgi:hypothetical protein